MWERLAAKISNAQFARCRRVTEPGHLRCTSVESGEEKEAPTNG